MNDTAPDDDMHPRTSESSDTVPSRERPLDLVHLARQTLGDRVLEEEVLAMFMKQLCGLGDKVRQAGERERRLIAHSVKGTARGMGAFALADCAAEMEAHPSDPVLHDRFSARIDEVRAFVAGLSR